MTHSSWLNVHIPHSLAYSAEAAGKAGLRGAPFAMVQMNQMEEKLRSGHTWANVRCLQPDRELLAGRRGQDQKRILVLRIKSNSDRTVLDSGRMSYWTIHCAEEE